MKPALSLLCLAALLAPVPGGATDDEAFVCNDIQQLPAIKELRQRTKVMHTKYMDLDGAARRFTNACNAYRANPSQNRDAGPLKDFVDSQGAYRTADQAFEAEVTKVRESWNKVKDPIQALAHASCVEHLRRLATQWLGNGPDTMKGHLAKVTTSCEAGDGATRADTTAKALGGGDEMKKALLDPRANPERSNELLQQARKYAQENGLPDPAGANPPFSNNTRDRVCGEACVALLRARMLCSDYDSAECTYAREAAKATRRGRYGIVYPAT